MANNKHLTFDERNTIESMLKHKTSFRKIGDAIDKDPSTISKEIRLHRFSQRSGGRYTGYNACALRSTCEKSRICNVCHAHRRYKHLLDILFRKVLILLLIHNRIFLL